MHNAERKQNNKKSNENKHRGYGYKGNFNNLAYNDVFVHQGNIEQTYIENGLDAEGIKNVAKILDGLKDTNFFIISHKDHDPHHNGKCIYNCPHCPLL